jgi:hypothetical protein
MPLVHPWFHPIDLEGQTPQRPRSRMQAPIRVDGIRAALCNMVRGGRHGAPI